MRRTLRLLLLGLPLILSAAEGDAAWFETHVRPLLHEHCLECHSTAKKVKGGLALDARVAWEKGGDAGPAIIPGKPDESLLIKAVSWQDLDLQMPPKYKLGEREQAVLAEWIRRGAPDPRGAEVAVKAHATGMSLADGRRFWSYVPLAATPVPPVADTSWPHNDIDRFILAKLEAARVRPAADAETLVLVRRLVLVLTGLPPTEAQIDRFVQRAASDRAAAVAELADDLMATPAFAERFAGHWLTLTRFAESSGGGRTLLFKDAWRFRDYVVQAFAENRPLDRLIREHLAGDLIQAQNDVERARHLTATGFLALGPTIYEEQDKQRLRFDVIDEQIDTIGKAFLGQTISCARCHDHKFDPVSQRDYYALAGIFASTRTLSNYTDNVVSWIDHRLPLPAEQDQRVADAERRIPALEKQLKEAKNTLAKRKDVASGLAAKTNQPIPLGEVDGIVIDDDQAQASGMWKHSTYYFGTGYRHDDGKERGAKSLTFTPRLPASGRYEVRLAYPALAGRATKVPVHIFHARGDDTVYVDQTKQPDIEGRFVTLGTFTFDHEGASYVIVSNQGADGYVTADLVQFLPLGASVAMAAKEIASGPADQQDLRSDIARLEVELTAAKALVGDRPLVMGVRDEETIADTHIRVRGEVHQKAALVPRGFLSVLTRSPTALPSTQSGRRELAEWLVRDNPLTARVLANRVWTWTVGEGLVRTVDNFGTTGEAPTHPELLDHLARSLQRDWDVRALIRAIVTSRAWQLAVASSTDDPDNRLLAHAHRRRMDAEQIRDAILVVSGALDRTVGGPNIRGAASAASDSGAASAVEFAYRFDDVRRSLYTPAFRNNRLEVFALFDFGDINTGQGQRHATTSALQASWFLNSPFVREQARVTATAVLASGGTAAERLTTLFRRALGRPPLPAERAACERVLAAGANQDAWAMIAQSLFGSVEFRHVH